MRKGGGSNVAPEGEGVRPINAERPHRAEAVRRTTGYVPRPATDRSHDLHPAATNGPVARDSANLASEVANGPRHARPRWLGRYQLALLAIDLMTATLAGVAAAVFRFGADTEAAPHIVILSIVSLPVAWGLAAAGNGAYERRYVGVGTEEFSRIVRAFLHLTATATFLFYAADLPVARGFVFPALVLALVLDLLGRYAARKWLHRRRVAGASLTSVLAVGG